jgi:hypothetical protein
MARKRNVNSKVTTLNVHSLTDSTVCKCLALFRRLGGIAT